ncbi:MAG: 2OG-Fe(II) oxygenase [Rudaea sp.]|uniref:2OG-Fe(II) oxygenase family protein n=1 Tax=unclassified Rudaea TaxID=2627037 RepID=UPI0010F57346|nr:MULTISPECIES: 2OG-Fe(II) oxygenase [unclassified Rudaea]MBN8888354.1 2OG-Fe(II) oxygenase [Rudaea sp.]MBR0344969.1 2OG-Fe(II) oxygenase [Rudaea sp.]
MSESPVKPSLDFVGNLRSYVCWFDQALSADFCAQLIASFEQSAHLQTPNGRGHRAGLENSSWIEVNLTPVADRAFIGYFYAQIDKYLAEYNRRLGLTIPIPSRPTIDDLRMKRYRAGSDDNFEPHFDSHDEKSRRYLVFLWYLNDVGDGGETEFCDLGLRVDARAGRLLMFPPYWMFQHAGLPPRSNDKYILSTYLMF